MGKVDEIKATNQKVWASMMSRFPKFVKRGAADECWPWIGYSNEAGYGKFATCREIGPVRATHVSWALHGGVLPDGKYLLHSCDNPACVNPGHLRVGTPKENTQDCIVRGRKTAPPHFFGPQHHNAKLTLEQVEEIMKDERRPGLIAKEYGVNYMTVRRIRQGKHWGCCSVAA